jgi:hypothetical protein
MMQNNNEDYTNDKALLNVEDLHDDNRLHLQRLSFEIMDISCVDSRQTMKCKNLKLGAIYAGAFACGGFVNGLISKGEYNRLGMLIGNLISQSIGTIYITLLNAEYKLFIPKQNYNVINRFMVDAIQSGIAAVPANYTNHIVGKLMQNYELDSEYKTAIQTSILMGVYLYSYFTLLDQTAKCFQNFKCITYIEEKCCKINHISNNILKLLSEIITNSIAGICATEVNRFIQTINPQEDYVDKTIRYGTMGIVFSVAQTAIQGITNTLYAKCTNSKSTATPLKERKKEFSFLI